MNIYTLFLKKKNERESSSFEKFNINFDPTFAQNKSFQIWKKQEIKNSSMVG